jgi:hypothetical protein
MNGADKKVLADLKSKAAQNGVSGTDIAIDHSDEDTLFAIIDRYPRHVGVDGHDSQ